MLVRRLTSGKSNSIFTSTFCLPWPTASSIQALLVSASCRRSRSAQERRSELRANQNGRLALSSVAAAFMSDWVMVRPSVRADISVCLVLPYWLPETLLMSSLGACCHWLKRTWACVCFCMCVCERVTVRNWSSCLESASALPVR